MRDFPKVIPRPTRKTRWQAGARGVQNLEAGLRMNLIIAACSDIKMYAVM
jgi:hypothetical protein